MVDTLSSWGRYPAFPQTPHFTHWRGDLSDDLSDLASSYGSTLPYGQGRSYGDSCFAKTDHVLQTAYLNRFISFNRETGVIVAESGVTLEQVLSLVIPCGWFLPVTPGTKFVSLGGAIANDVHGKNHHVRGTFGRHVLSFNIVRSDGQKITCSLQENSELFSATIGGLGLTGVIESVELQLIPISSSKIDSSTIRFGSLNEFFSLSDEFDSKNEYSVAWVDCHVKGSSTGRGVYMTGNHSDSGDLTVNVKRKMSVPFTFPFSAINKMSLPLLNSGYYHLHKAKPQQAVINYEPFFYPLDRIEHWNRAYGRAGFQQYQCVIPENNAESAMHELLAAIASTGSGSFLAVMKRCGDIVSPGMISFPMPGLSLALDFPQSSSLNSTLFPRFDTIVREAGGRLYPAKDAHMSGEDFRTFYPDWKKVEKLRDPALCSRFWQRVIS
ncbi:MAG: FAD-binding oxidoreductase [Gammaproteobacteria bacterium]|nr:FAD-binding oxidoreductase [Gammaproteobacteria bacterium]